MKKIIKKLISWWNKPLLSQWVSKTADYPIINRQVIKNGWHCVRMIIEIGIVIYLIVEVIKVL